jgi:predicted NodU family carbamoyl transferase
MAKKPIYVLGTGVSHDGSACLIKDGHVCVAIEKERITRIKHHGGNDSLAIQYCLDAEGIALDDLTLVVQNANFGNFERGNSFFGGPRPFSDGSDLPIVTISHHLAHAYSALGICPFEEPNILVVDGCGNGLDECTDLEGLELPVEPDDDIRHLYFEKDSYYAWRDGRLRVVYKDFSPWGMRIKGYTMLPNTTKHSIGGVYSAVSSYCFQENSDQGKLMGLAPYGRPGVFKDEIFELKDGRAFVRYDWMKPFDRPALGQEQFKQDFQYYADIAYWVQREVERALLYLVDSRYEAYPGESLAYAGGVALNAVANSLIVQRSKFKRLYMVPAAGDNGIAMGCAFYGWLEVLKQERMRHSGTPFHGRSYLRVTIERALETAREASVAASLGERESPAVSLLRAAHEHLSIPKMGGWQGAIEWQVQGLGNFAGVIDGTSCRFFSGEAPAGATAVSLSRRTLMQLFQGSFDPTLAVASGELVSTHLDTLLLFYRSIDWSRLREEVRKGLLTLGAGRERELFFEGDEDFIETTARLLSEGKIVAWFQEGAEFGPRALGHRSLLADPRRPEVRDLINKLIKRREEFRPFAPSVLLADASRYFEFEGESPYMILVAQVRSEWRGLLGSVTHCDGSARLQTVTRDWNQRYFDLLQAFQRRTGLPVLLNTSLNRRGMPIVETPEDALNFFRESPSLDILVMDRFIVSRAEKETRQEIPYPLSHSVMAG